MVAALLATAVIGCAHQSGAGFPNAYHDPGNLVVGPMAWMGARRGDSDGAYMGAYRWKQPVLVRPGHTVTLRIAPAAQNFAGLQYGHAGGWEFESTSPAVKFRSCSAKRAESRTDGRPVTFWSGGVVLTKSPACVPVQIRIDRRPLRRRVLAYGGARC